MSPNAKIILPHFEAYLEESGFSRLVERDLFEQKTIFGSNYMLLDFNYDRGLDEIVLTCGVENSACSHFFNGLFPHQTENHLPSILYHSFYLNLSDSTAKPIDEFKSQMTREGHLFFQRYGDEQNLEYAINEHPTKAFPYISRPLRRIAYGLFLAHRFQSPAFPDLVAAYKRILDNPKMNVHFGRIIDALWRG